MVAWLVKDFGGRIPRQDPRLLPDNMGEVAENVDLSSGPLDGLPSPKLIIDLTGTAGYLVRKAYRYPAPVSGGADVWLPLPSEYSSVVRSPLANDTLHRIYWTNPQGQPAAGAYWNSYARLAAGGLGANAAYNMGFIAPASTIILTVVPSGGTTTVPQISRSYCFTYVNQYGEESSPCQPSAVVDGAPDATWTISGLPTGAPGNPAGKNYPTVTHMRLYRTIVGTSTGAQFFTVIDLNFGPSTYADTLPDTSIVNNNLLESTSWAPPPDDLDGLIGMTGGMLIGFSGNTIHFCEADRPHAWPAGYDQSLMYVIVGLAVWQQSLVVLTKGYPSMGSGSNPSNMQFATVQAPEPCISRGSIVTDLAGVYYSSQNGLIMLSYFGMTNQTLSNMTRQIWLREFKGDQLIACRHRTQYLAINGSDSGFLIDYSEQRMGVVTLSTFLNAVSVWNDAYTGDAYICADQKVYLWDDAGMLDSATARIIMRCTFTAPNDTRLRDYNYAPDIGANFFNVGSGTDIRVEDGVMPTPRGTGIYQATAVPDMSDYGIRFEVRLPLPPVNPGDALWVVARAVDAGHGYQVMISNNGSTYTAAVNVLGTPVSYSAALGHLAGETELDVYLLMIGARIALFLTRHSDGFQLDANGDWTSNPAAAAISFTDATYINPGVIIVGATGA